MAIESNNNLNNIRGRSVWCLVKKINKFIDEVVIQYCLNYADRFFNIYLVIHFIRTFDCCYRIKYYANL